MYRKMCLVIIDMQSKWIEATFVPSATSTATIEILRSSLLALIYRLRWYPITYMYFVSKEMETFFKDNDI